MNESENKDNIYTDNFLADNTVNERTALMDGHVGESHSRHSDRFVEVERNMKKRKSGGDGQPKTYGVIKI